MRVIEPPIKLSQWDSFFPTLASDIPEGYQSAVEIAIETGRNNATVSKKLRNSYRMGLVDMIVGRRPGDRNPKQYFRLKGYENNRDKKPSRNR